MHDMKDYSQDVTGIVWLDRMKAWAILLIICCHFFSECHLYLYFFCVQVSCVIFFFFLQQETNVSKNSLRTVLSESQLLGGFKNCDGYIDFENSDEVNMKFFLDFLMIAKALKIYLVKSEKMYNSDFARRASMIYNRPFELFKYFFL